MDRTKTHQARPQKKHTQIKEEKVNNCPQTHQERPQKIYIYIYINKYSKVIYLKTIFRNILLTN